MSKRGDAEFVCDILEAIKRIEQYVEKCDYAKFLEDNMIQDAVVRNLEIVGEAVKNISETAKEKYGNIEWKKLAGMRDRIVHFYFGVNWDIVWDVIKNRLPELKKQIELILKVDNDA